MRIRSIKPEMLSDQKIANLTDSEFRCFIGLILLADDYGNARCTPNYVLGQIFWASRETVDVKEILKRLSRESLVTLYQVNSQEYLHICGWSKHQKVNHPGKPWVPPMPRLSQEVKESLLPDLRIEGSKEQGSSSPNGELCRVENSTGDSSSDPNSSDSAEVLAHYSMFHPKARPGAKERRLLRDRLREKYSADDLKRAISGYHISPFHCGVNQGNTTYLSLSLILRDSSHVQNGIELCDKGTPIAISEKGLRAKFAVESFLSRGKPKL